MRRALKIIAGLFAVLIIAIVAVIMFFDWNMVRSTVAGRLSESAGRKVAIEGDLRVQYTWPPRITAERITLANAEWSREPLMVSIDRLDFLIKPLELLRGRIVLPELRLDAPKIVLERNPEGKANWEFNADPVADAATPDERGDFPVIGLLEINNGALIYRDAPQKIDIDAKIASASGSGSDGTRPVAVEASGTMRGQKMLLKAQGGSLLSLRNENEPYPLSIDVRIGDTRASLDGKLAEAMSFGGLDAKFAIAGPNPALLVPILGIPIPQLPPYELTGTLRQEGAVWSYRGFKGKVGDSDLAGDISVDTGRERPFIEANLVSNRLDLDDIGLIVGAPPSPEQAVSARQKEVAARAAGSDRLLPDAPLQIDEVRAVDAKVSFKGKKVGTPDLPLGDLNLALDLKDGVLRLNPLDVSVAGGRLNSVIAIDARKDVVVTDYDIRLRGFDLAQLVASANPPGAGASGKIEGRAKFRTWGNTLRRAFATADGDVTLMMDTGLMSNLLLEAIGLDLGEALIYYLGKDRLSEVRCFVADFGWKDGLLFSRTFVLDTSDTLITGKIDVNFKDAGLRGRIAPEPKDVSILSARVPINIGGRLKNPQVTPDVAMLAARGGAAVALGALLTPFASILAFIEPGTGKDSNCAGLLSEAHGKAGAPMGKRAPGAAQPSR